MLKTANLKCIWRGHPHRNASVCKSMCLASFWPIVHMDPVNPAPVNTLFWNLVSGWKNPKCCPCILVWTAMYQWHHRPTPRPLAFDPPRLIITTTTTMVDYMLVFVPQKILSLLGLLGQNITLLCHYPQWKRIMDNWIAIFVIFLFCSVSPSTPTSPSPFLVNFKQHL